MGVITLTLITAGVLSPDSGPPFWVILSAGLAIALGTYIGGCRIIQALGKRVSEIQTPQGFAAETSSAAITPGLLAPGLRALHDAGGHRLDLRRGGRPAARLGAVGRGRADGDRLAADPAGGRGGRAVAGSLANTGTVGTIIVALVAVAIGGGIYAASRRRPVTADNVNEVPAPTPVGADA
jgi:inorganic phosphate transporter, PiT family